MEIDIFTEVGSLGAVAALLYSLTANACLMNQEYIQDFQKPIDVYSTTNLQAARLIDSQFQNVGSSAYWYNSAMLNASSSSIYSQLSNTAQVLSSAAVSASADTTSTDGTDTNNATSFVVSDLTSISSTIDPNDGMNATMMTLNEAATTATPVTGRAKRQAATSSTTHLTTASSSHIAASAVVTSQAPAYLIAVLANVNTVFASNSSNGSSGNGTGSSSSTNSSGGQNMTGFAMIILYAITGCVTIMFLIVIASGVGPSLFICVTTFKERHTGYQSPATSRTIRTKIWKRRRLGANPSQRHHSCDSRHLSGCQVRAQRSAWYRTAARAERRSRNARYRIWPTQRSS